MSDGLFIITIDENGWFVKERERVYSLEVSGYLRLIFKGQNSTFITPYMVTNYNNEKNKLTKIRNSQEIEGMKLQDIFEQYNLIKGSFEENLNWSCDFIFEEKGTYTFQIIQIKKDELKQNQTIKIKERIEYSDRDSCSFDQLDYNLIFYEKINHINIQPPYVNKMRDICVKTHNFINLQTLFPSMMGEIDEWEDFLRQQIKKGYNGFHFAPIQELGFSDSLYCIRNHLTPNPKIFGKEKNFVKLKKIFDNLKKEFNCLFIIDIVLNHCSSDAQWLQQHQESCFNIQNIPELTAASILDEYLLGLNSRLKEILGKEQIDSIQEVNQIIHFIEIDGIKKFRFENYFQFDIDKLIQDISTILIQENDEVYFENFKKFNSNFTLVNSDHIQAIRKKIYNAGASKFGAKIDVKWLVNLLKEIFIHPNEAEARKLFKDINFIQSQMVKNWENDIIGSLRGELTYRFIECNRKKPTSDYRLFSKYFEKINGVSVALNGWIMNYDKSKEFILSKDQFYLRRQVMIWEDLVKLNFSGNDKNSFIWKHMKQYTDEMADIFDGFRLDNFHNSYIRAAQYFIDSARSIKPNLFIISELFTPDAQKKSSLVSRIGIHRLVKEFHHVSSLEQLLYELKFQMNVETFWKLNKSKTFNDFAFQDIKAVYPREILYDQTHDNKSYYEKGNFKIQLPLLALMSCLNKMLGTNMGYDELITQQYSVTCQKKYPKVEQNQQKFIQTKIKKVIFFNKFAASENLPQVNQVEIKGSWDNWQNSIQMKESKELFWTDIFLDSGLYEYKFIINGYIWTTDNNHKKTLDGQNNWIEILPQQYSISENLIGVREYFNNCHSQIFSEKIKLRIKQKNDFIIFKRYNEMCKSGCIIITRVNFQQFDSLGQLDLRLHSMVKEEPQIYYFDKEHEIVENENGFQRVKAKLIQKHSLDEYGGFTQANGYQFLNLRNVPENFVLVIKFQYSEEIQNNIDYIFKLLNSEIESHLNKTVVSIKDINYYMFTCSNEEKEYWRSDCFNLENHGQLPFAGFAGIKKILQNAYTKQDYSHPLFLQLKNHNFLIDYYLQRVNRYEMQEKQQFIDFFNNISQKIKILPRFLKPYYFSNFILQVISFFENQYLGSIKSNDTLKTNQLYQNLLLALPQYLTQFKGNLYLASAGLPHFTTGIWKNWGRDTFMSFKGCFIIPGFLKEAREILLYYSKYMRHGLIPNLLTPTRFNSRDATWWFVKALSDYLDHSQDYSILKETVEMVFLSNNEEEHNRMKSQNYVKTNKFLDIVQEIFQCHALGIQFKEWGAPYIDEHMNDFGFNIRLWVDWENGFIFGGNKSNCLTWMDKMGSSVKAKNKGVPATSRNGSPIELVSLLYLGLKTMKILYQENYSNYEGVKTGEGEEDFISFEDWRLLIKENFQKYYWVEKPDSPEFDNYKLEPWFIGRTEILKDCYSQQKTDYQLRPNAIIVLALTPSLITEDQAIKYLEKVRLHLVNKSSIGIKTLDPKDPNYRGYYDNSNDSDDFNTAHGFCYHNGPEWVWLYGFYLMALHRFESQSEHKISRQIERLKNHLNVIENSEWLSLPELTNENGYLCRDSCSSQLWSVSCLLDAIDLLKF